MSVRRWTDVRAPSSSQLCCRHLATTCCGPTVPGTRRPAQRVRSSLRTSRGAEADEVHPLPAPARLLPAATAHGRLSPRRPARRTARLAPAAPRGSGAAVVIDTVVRAATLPARMVLPGHPVSRAARASFPEPALSGLRHTGLGIESALCCAAGCPSPPPRCARPAVPAGLSCDRAGLSPCWPAPSRRGGAQQMLGSSCRVSAGIAIACTETTEGDRVQAPICYVPLPPIVACSTRKDTQAEGRRACVTVSDPDSLAAPARNPLGSAVICRRRGGRAVSTRGVMRASSWFWFEGDLESDRLGFGGLRCSSRVPWPSRVALFQRSCR